MCFSKLQENIYCSIPTSPKDMHYYFQNLADLFFVSPSLFLVYTSNFFLLSILRLMRTFSRRLICLLRYPSEYYTYVSKFQKNLATLEKINKTTILCIIDRIDLGGSDRVIYNTIRGINRDNFAFYLITAQPDNDKWTLFQKEYDGIFNEVIFHHGKSAHINYLCYSALIKALNAKIVLTTHSDAVYHLLPKLKLNNAHVGFVDLIHIETYPSADVLIKTAPYIDKRVCISDKVKQNIANQYKKYPPTSKLVERLQVIYNGVSLTKFNPANNRKGSFKAQYSISKTETVISFVGRLSNEKNPLAFVNIAKKVQTELPNIKIKFVIAGDGPQTDQVKNAIKRLKLENSVILTGAIDNVPDLLNDSYLLLVPSTSEGIPFAILEALAMCVPVISTSVGAITEVLQSGVNGFLVKPDQRIVQSFVGLLLDLLTNDKLYSNVASRARASLLPKFTLENMCGDYEKVFSDLVSD
jgi:glycosyltransferase involved in cell wall biosynthesis